MAEQKVNTSTNIRNIYSDLSYLNMKFYNSNLSFQFHPFVSKDANGKSQYNQQYGLMTTVSFDGAFALHQIAMDIINGKEASKGVLLVIPCASGVQLILERKPNQTGQMETMFLISRNNETIPFKFSTNSYQTNENGQQVTKVVESGLGTFAKTIEGYLTGINSDRHLNKMTEDYIKSLGEGNQQFQTGSGYQPKGGYNNSGGYQKKWNNNKKPYNQNYGGGAPQHQSWESQQPNTQNMSTYNIPQ